MSKTVAKPQKVTVEEDQSAVKSFETAPKLFSRWSYDDIKVNHSTNSDRRPLLH